MSKKLYFLIFIILPIFKIIAQEAEPITIGTKHLMYSEVLEEEREFWVNLPASYNVKTNFYKKYPVLVLLDGNVFFNSISGMCSYMSSGRNGKIPEMIIIGIKNVNRNRDYTPDKIITTRKNDFGGGDQFLRFLEEELLPKVDKEYRTQPFRILFGHSLGGVLANHTYMKEHTLFNAFISVDPSMGSWDESVMDQKLEGVSDQSFNRYLYLATANWGKRNIRNRDRHVRFYESLHSKCPGNFHAKIEYFENEDHSSVPTIAFHNGIKTIFDGYGISYRDIEDKSSLISHFEKISNRLSFEIYPPENLINQLGYRYLRSSDKEEQLKALEFFILNTEIYPDSYNAFDSLGEAYQMMGALQKAKMSFERSLSLNPDNEHAIEALKKI